MTSAAVHVPPPVVVVKSCGASSGAAERCLMHLKRMLCATQEKLDSSQNHIVVQHEDAHAIIVLHVDSSSCTPIVGGGIALDSLHCAAQARHYSIYSLLLFLFSSNHFFFVLTSFQYMLLSLLFRSTSQESHCGVSYFSLVVVGLQPRLLVDCTEVTRSNITKSLTSLAAHMEMLPSLLDSQQSSRPIHDLDFFIATCLSIAQARPFKPGIIMITECNISSSCNQVCALMFLTKSAN